MYHSLSFNDLHIQKDISRERGVGHQDENEELINVHRTLIVH